MTAWIGLLRAVNVGGHNRVRMADLRECLEELGLRDARTLLQSGNFVADGAAREVAGLERRLERAARARLGIETQVFLRTPAEWRALIAENPFPHEARSDPGYLHAVVLKSAPLRARVSALESAITGPEVIRAHGRELFAYYPDGAGRSKLTPGLIEKHLGTTGTARNWNTVLKLQDMLETP